MKRWESGDQKKGYHWAAFDNSYDDTLAWGERINNTWCLISNEDLALAYLRGWTILRFKGKGQGWEKIDGSYRPSTNQTQESTS